MSMKGVVLPDLEESDFPNSSNIKKTQINLDSPDLKKKIYNIKEEREEKEINPKNKETINKSQMEKTAVNNIKDKNQMNYERERNTFIDSNNRSDEGDLIKSNINNKLEIRNLKSENNREITKPERRFFSSNASVNIPFANNAYPEGNKFNDITNKVVSKEKVTRKSFEEKNQFLLESFRNMLKEASSNILIKNDVPEKARKVEELTKSLENLNKENNSIKRAFEEREKFYKEKIQLLEAQLNDPITEDISSIQSQIKGFDNQIEIFSKTIKDMNESNKIERENFYKITTELINCKKKLGEELVDLEKYKKLFFWGNNQNRENKPEVILKYNFDDNLNNSVNHENTEFDQNNQNDNHRQDNPISNKNVVENQILLRDNEGYSPEKNRSIQQYPKILRNNMKPPHPENRNNSSSRKN